jgi:hypothetical protein
LPLFTELPRDKVLGTQEPREQEREAGVSNPGPEELTDQSSSGLRVLYLARYLEDGNFVLLHVRYPSTGGLRYPTTYTRRCFLSRTQGFFALPQG